MVDERFQTLLPLVKNIRIRLQSLSASFRTPAPVYLYRASLESVTLRLGLSHSDHSHLHRAWLGTREHDPAVDGRAYSLSCEIRAVALQRAMPEKIWMSLLSVRRIHSAILSTDWISKPPRHHRFFPDDPNSHLLAVTLEVEGVELTERIDAINESLNRSIPKTPPDTNAPSRQPRATPRLILDILVRDVSLTIVGVERPDTGSIVSLHTRTAGFEMHLATLFSQISRQITPPSSDAEQCLWKMDASMFASLAPIFVNLSAATSLDRRATMYRTAVEEPFLSVDRVELIVNGEALAQDPENCLALVDMPSLVLNAACSCEFISLGLWNSSRMSALRELTTALVFPTEKPAAPAQPLVDRLPSGVSVRLAVRSISVVVTALDVNPDCTLELSRGLAMRTGISLEYCFLQTNRQLECARQWHAEESSKRQKHQLPGALWIEAVAKAKSQPSTEDRTALIVCSLRETTCRAAVTTDLASDEDIDDDDDSQPDKSSTLMHVSPASFSFEIHRRHQRAFFDSRPTDSIHMTASIKTIDLKFSLPNAYSALLAMQAVLHLVPPRSEKRRAVPSANRTSVSLTFSVETIDASFDFPLGERLFIRLQASRYIHQSSPRPFEIVSDSVRVWVPRAQGANFGPYVSGQWDELIRITKLVMAEAEGAASGKSEIVVASDVLRLRIPASYKISNLVANITLSFKSLMHLRRAARQGAFFAPPPPQPESARVVPSFRITISTTILEAEDLFLDSQLNLIARAGAQAQRIRLEREYAFDEKVSAITEPNPHNPRLKSDYNFSAKHTVSVADARNRMNMVHSSSWATLYRSARAEQVKREEQITNQSRISRPIDEQPYPIDRRTPDVAPPLIRIQLAQLDLCIGPPQFQDQDVADFLYENGDEMPRETQYTLLIPFFLHATLCRAVIELRDYPLPLLFVPPHPGIARSTPALEFKSNIVIAEEVGPPTAIRWVDCIVVPKDSGTTDAAEFRLRLPKTAMSIKTYANPTIHISTPGTTYIGWSSSYLPAMQDVVKVIDSLTSSPPDRSPPVGFWDKLRFQFHWKITATFASSVQFTIKGTFS